VQVHFPQLQRLDVRRALSAHLRGVRRHARCDRRAGLRELRLLGAPRDARGADGPGGAHDVHRGRALHPRHQPPLLDHRVRRDLPADEGRGDRLARRAGEVLRPRPPQLHPLRRAHRRARRAAGRLSRTTCCASRGPGSTTSPVSTRSSARGRSNSRPACRTPVRVRRGPGEFPAPRSPHVRSDQARRPRLFGRPRHQRDPQVAAGDLQLRGRSPSPPISARARSSSRRAPRPS
jgi:hypothetical protein